MLVKLLWNKTVKTPNDTGSVEQVDLVHNRVFKRQYHQRIVYVLI